MNYQYIVELSKSSIETLNPKHWIIHLTDSDDQLSSVVNASWLGVQASQINSKYAFV